jgi:bifunctional non-homologous end joining protein LigD
MYASIGREIPREEGWTYEPKYDGIRVLAEIGRERIRLVTRNDKDKAAQFPEVVEALRTFGDKAGVPVVLDGEIVALDGKGKPLRFQELQARMHVQDMAKVAGIAAATPAALVAFDVLVADGERLLALPWSERRRRLEKLLRNRTSARLHLTETAPNAGESMLARARAQGWEGVIAKRMTARYRPGARSDDWRKLKIEFRQEFVVGGWTEPRRSRQHIGALLLGAFDAAGRFHYVGHAGGGFTSAGLEAMYRRLARIERATSPFAERVVTNEPAHWVRPSVVVEVKFSEWTADGKLRQPIFLGVRDDKPAREVTIEATSVQRRRA